MRDEDFMRLAIRQAELAELNGEVPVGAVLVREGRLLAVGYNQPIGRCDPTAHAEIIVMRQAGQIINNYRITDVELYVTLEPCLMCVGALLQARIKRLIFGAFEKRTGAIEVLQRLSANKQTNHTIEIQGGVLASDCSELLARFFRERR